MRTLGDRKIDGFFFSAGDPYPPPALHAAAADAARQLTLLLDRWQEKYPGVDIVLIEPTGLNIWNAIAIREAATSR